ncbi:MAG: hypothetical protein HYX54_09340 [Chloroflexi bacterium]|nr:hypothetical protein [Chloroflexota bacterium]
MATPTPTEETTPAPTEEATPAPDPVAELVTADTTIVGTLGSSSIDGRGSDAPWLPFDSLPPVATGVTDLLTVRFSDRVAVGDFSTVIATADDTSGSNPRGVDGSVLAADAKTVRVGPLPVGQWVLSITLFRADGRGQGTTFWAVTVH